MDVEAETGLILQTMATARLPQSAASLAQLLVWRSPSEAVNASAMVPMDVSVGAGTRAVVITGPNTGGKTVILKTLGVAALMAKAGLRVLCDDASAGAAASGPLLAEVRPGAQPRGVALHGERQVHLELEPHVEGELVSAHRPEPPDRV